MKDGLCSVMRSEQQDWEEKVLPSCSNHVSRLASIASVLAILLSSVSNNTHATIHLKLWIQISVSSTLMLGGLMCKGVPQPAVYRLRDSKLPISGQKLIFCIYCNTCEESKEILLARLSRLFLLLKWIFECAKGWPRLLNQAVLKYSITLNHCFKKQKYNLTVYSKGSQSMQKVNMLL